MRRNTNNEGAEPLRSKLIRASGLISVILSLAIGLSTAPRSASAVEPFGRPVPGTNRRRGFCADLAARVDRGLVSGRMGDPQRSSDRISIGCRRRGIVRSGGAVGTLRRLRGPLDFIPGGGFVRGAAASTSRGTFESSGWVPPCTPSCGAGSVKERGMVIALGICVGAGVTARRRDAGAVAGAFLCAVLAWRGFIWIHDLPTEPRSLDPNHWLASVGDISQWLWSRRGEVSGALLVAWLSTMIALLRRETAGVVVAVGVWAAGVLAAYSSSLQGVPWHLGTSFDRVVSAPLAGAAAVAFSAVAHGASRSSPTELDRDLRLGPELLSDDVGQGTDVSA